MAFSAVLDACVLYPFSLRDVLLRCAERNLYVPAWSARILDEMETNLIANHAADATRVRRMRSCMTRAFEEACYEVPDSLENAMTNHPKDRHVLAAAVVSRSEVIVTANLRDFRTEHVEPLGVHAIAPDDFLTDLYHHDRDAVFSVVTALVKDLTRPPVSWSQLLERLTKAGCPTFAQTMRDHASGLHRSPPHQKAPRHSP